VFIALPFSEEPTPGGAEFCRLPAEQLLNAGNWPKTVKQSARNEVKVF
jgi:hypothetical protein